MSAKAGILQAAGHTGSGAWILVLLFAVLLTAALLAVTAGSTSGTDVPTGRPVTTDLSNPGRVARGHPHGPAATSFAPARTFGEPIQVGDYTCHQCA